MHTLALSAKIPVIDFGGEGELILFSHANGYPPGVYRQLLESLTPHYRVLAVEHRPLWQNDPAGLESWQQFADDVIELLDELGEPVHGFGHSMGGSTLLLVAERRPDAFRSLALMEPVLLPSLWQFGLRQVGKFFPQKVPPIQRALNRVDRWDSEQAVYAHFRPKAVFRGFSDEALWDLVSHSTRAGEDGGVTLRFSKEWEARCYALVHNVWPSLRRLRAPLIGFRGEKSNTLAPREWKRWQALRPEGRFHLIEDSGHLLPLERPQLISQYYLAWQQRLTN